MTITLLTLSACDGGVTNVVASGDGLDSNGSLLISGGEVYVSGSPNGADASLDADGSIIVNGGKLFATGALGMMETPAKNSEQNCLSFAHSSTIKSGTILHLTDSNGKELMSYTVQNDCRSVILSCPELQMGNTYYIYGGDTQLCSFTVNDTITTVGSSNNIGNPGSRPGRW